MFYFTCDHTLSPTYSPDRRQESSRCRHRHWVARKLYVYVERRVMVSVQMTRCQYQINYMHLTACEVGQSPVIWPVFCRLFIIDNMAAAKLDAIDVIDGACVDLLVFIPSWISVHRLHQQQLQQLLSDALVLLLFDSLYLPSLLPCDGNLPSHVSSQQNNNKKV